MEHNELAHYGVKGMKWGVRKAYKYYARKERSALRFASGASTESRKQTGMKAAKEFGRRKNEAKRAYDALRDPKTVEKGMKMAEQIFTKYRKKGFVK